MQFIASSNIWLLSDETPADIDCIINAIIYDLVSTAILR